ncbi:MAG: AAA family ATPase, partial [Thiotrichaceae bacterium]|nr:AAA family ATPase [Thiotrichaceae bacterium]
NELQVKLAASLNHIVHDLLAEKDSSRKVKRINVFINAKGGSGTSFIASNVAYSLAQFSNSNTALIDLDLQFGSIGLYFDKTPEYAISEALKMLEHENGMDSVSLEAYIEKYNDKLGMLLTSQDEFILPSEISPAAFQRLIALIQVRYNQVVIDLPRIIDPLSSAVMEQADQVTIVLQQSLVQFRDCRRLINILNKELESPLERISLVINRYDENNKLKKDDIIGMVSHNKVYTVRNDFDRVASALNLGVPLCESAPKSKIAKDLKKIAMELGKIHFNEKNHSIFSFFKR